MVNKYLHCVIIFPAVLWLLIPQVYSPWYVENLLASPLIFLLGYFSLLALVARYIKIQVVLISFVVNFLIVTIISLKNVSRNDSNHCNNPITIFQFNNSYDDKYIARLSNFLTESQYDLVVLQEISPLSREALIDSLSPFYPYFVSGISPTRHLTTDQLILSKYRFTDTRYHQQGLTSHVIQMQWHVQHKPIHLFTLHPPSPRTQELWKKRNLSLYQLMNQVKLLGNETVLLVGDFNLSSYSARMEPFNKGLSGDFIGSWPNFTPFPAYFTLAIDHVFVSPSVQTCSRERIENFNYSDHYPILTKISL